MLEDFDAAANFIHGRECAPSGCQIVTDMAGRTIHGISEKNHPDMWKDGHIPTLDDFKSLLDSHYWGPLRCTEMPWPVNLSLLDFAYHSGNKQASKSLQRVLNELGEAVGVDGKIGDATLAAIRSVCDDGSPRFLARALCAAREAFLLELCDRDPEKYGPYRRGWLRRIDRLEEKIG